MNQIEIDKLLQRHKNLIEQEVNKYATHLPRHVVQLEAHRLAAEAARQYDPSKGKFSTILTVALKKLQRMSTTYGNPVRSPEDKQFAVNRLNLIIEELKSDLGREPSNMEIASKAGMSLREVNSIMQHKVNFFNLNNSTIGPAMVDNQNDDWLHYVYHDLVPRDQVIFDHKFGFAGKPILKNTDIAKKLNVSNSLVNKRIKLINSKLQEGWMNDY